MKRVYVDFNTMQTDDKERVFINTAVNDGLAQELQPGMPVVLYDECLEVAGTVEFEPANGFWYGVPDWSKRKDL